MSNKPAPRPKNWLSPHLKAAGLSHLFPGVGQFYNKQPVKGTFFVVATLVALIAMFITLATGFSAVVGSWVSLSDPSYNVDVNPITALGPAILLMGSVIVLFVWSIIDAWTVAKRRGVTAAPEAAPEEPAASAQPVLPAPPPPPPTRG